MKTLAESAAATLCVISDNYSPTFAGRDAKMKMLTEEAKRFFGKENVLIVSGSRLPSIGKRIQAFENSLSVQRTGRLLHRRHRRLFYISSGSDRDPGQGTSAKELVHTVRWFLERNHPVHLICWAFQTLFLQMVPVLNSILRRENLPPVRVEDVLPPKPSAKIQRKDGVAKKEVEEEESGEGKKGGTYHRFLGNTVVSNHRFGVLFPFSTVPPSVALRCVQRAFSKCFRSKVPGGSEAFADLRLETYSRAGKRVLSFFSTCTGTFVGTQFHPERQIRSSSVPTPPTGLIHFLRQQVLPRRFRNLLPHFLPKSELCAPQIQPSNATERGAAMVERGWFRLGEETRFFRLFLFSCKQPADVLPDPKDFLTSVDKFLLTSLSLLLQQGQSEEERGETQLFLRQVRSRFQDKCSIFYYPSLSVRSSVKAGMSRWLRTQEFNGGFQPTGVPAVFLFRKEGVQEVVRHEICHFLVDSGYLPELAPAAAVAQEHLEAVDLLCRDTGSVLRAEEGFIELLSNCLSIEGAVKEESGQVPSPSRQVAVRNLIHFLLQRCTHLREAKDWQRWRCLVQKSCIFSYFFLRTALLVDLFSSWRKGQGALLPRFKEQLRDTSRIQEVTGRAVQLLVSPLPLEIPGIQNLQSKKTVTDGVMTPDVQRLFSRQQKI